VYTGIKPAAFCSISTKLAVVVDDDLDRQVLLYCSQEIAEEHR